MRVDQLYHLNIPHDHILYLLSRDSGNIYLPYEIKTLFQEKRYFAFLYRIKLFLHSKEWPPHFIKSMLAYIWALISRMSNARCPKLIDCIFDLLAAMTSIDCDEPNRVEEFVKIIAKRHIDKAMYIRDNMLSMMGHERSPPHSQHKKYPSPGRNGGSGANASDGEGERKGGEYSQNLSPSHQHTVTPHWTPPLHRSLSFTTQFPPPPPHQASPPSSGRHTIVEERELRLARSRIAMWAESENPLTTDPSTNAFTYMYDIEANIIEFVTVNRPHLFNSDSITPTGTNSSEAGEDSMTLRDLFNSYLINQLNNYYSFYHDFRDDLTGVYLLYYIGKNAFYRGLMKASIALRCPIYIGKADNNMREILLFIAKKIHHAKDLSINDFIIRMILVKDPVYAPLLEATYIKEFQPIWNSEVSGIAFDRAKGIVPGTGVGGDEPVIMSPSSGPIIQSPGEINSHTGNDWNLWDMYHVKQDTGVIRLFHQEFCEDPRKREYQPLDFSSGSAHKSSPHHTPSRQSRGHHTTTVRRSGSSGDDHRTLPPSSQREQHHPMHYQGSTGTASVLTGTTESIMPTRR